MEANWVFCISVSFPLVSCYTTTWHERESLCPTIAFRFRPKTLKKSLTIAKTDVFYIITTVWYPSLGYPACGESSSV